MTQDVGPKLSISKNI